MTQEDLRLTRTLSCTSSKMYRTPEQISSKMFSNDYDPLLKRVRTERTKHHLDTLVRKGLVEVRAIGERAVYRRRGRV